MKFLGIKIASNGNRIHLYVYKQVWIIAKVLLIPMMENAMSANQDTSYPNTMVFHKQELLV